MTNLQVTALKRGDQGWVTSLLQVQWGSTHVVARGRLIDANQLAGFKVVLDATPAGLVTYQLDGDACEIVTIDSLVQGRGIGTRLLEAVAQIARDHQCKRMWLITTNDNLNALRFYQKRGFTLTALYPNALVESRRLKPEIPEIGLDGIPLRDEIELAFRLD